MKKNTIWKRLFSYLKPCLARLFFTLVFAAASTAFMVLAPFLVGRVTTTLFDSIRDGSFYWQTLLRLLAALVCVYLVSQLFSVLQGFSMAKLTADVMKRLRADIDAKMHRLNLNYYDAHTHGDILSVITNDVDTLNNALSQNLTSIVTQVITAAGILAMMLTISPSLTLIPVVMVPLSLLGAARVMKASEAYYSRQQTLLGALNGYIEEMYNGPRFLPSQQPASGKLPESRNHRRNGHAGHNAGQRFRICPLRGNRLSARDRQYAYGRKCPGNAGIYKKICGALLRPRRHGGKLRRSLCRRKPYFCPPRRTGGASRSKKLPHPRAFSRNGILPKCELWLLP